MQLRRVPALTTALALALTLGLSACATKVVGSPIAAAGGPTGEQTASGKPSSTKTSSPKASTKESAPKTTEGDKPAGNVKITTKKKTEGYEDCDILTPEEVAAAVGASKGGEKGCVQSTENPFSVVLFMVTFAEYEGEARTIEVGGNTAYEVKEKGGDCTVLVMLTDDPDEITPAFQATVTPIDDINPCEIALKLATKAFEKIPNA
ncbi:DUF3558 domain-containing protein [Saccharothrix sp. S26]|uniref:DUF3558 domain-containing protein n=1 Tax=Saccharothrix sp. S26 TaxID=2907215 RepID=UPI001F23D8C3|nr:DUF3558 domain-containing protein [Saccharothrix sp. S26]MCE7000864.1 DUF3558 domain-containing protein [Saccharothrix sp. S26]